MDRETFEQLVSEWLDSPSREELRARIDAALADDPTLAESFAPWQRLDSVFRENLPQTPGIAWPELARRISRAVDREMEDTGGVDEVLRRSPGVADQVDWRRVHGRIAGAVEREARGRRQTRGRRHLRWIMGSVAAVAAAAAALVLSVMPDARPERTSPGRATFAIAAPPTAEQRGSGGVASVAITVMNISTAEPERFFMVDPMTTPAPMDDVPLFY